jgi:peptidoglycan/xylan/chitin deacetylase (PgdA/CDA1 family)/putative cell wall-binding protein
MVEMGGRRSILWLLLSSVLLAGPLSATSGTSGARLTAAAGVARVSAGDTSAAGDVGFAVARLGGSSVAGTAAAVSRRFFSPGVAAAFVVTSASFADVLAIGPAAARLGAPVLYAGRSAVPSPTVAELRRLRPDRIYVVGSRASIGESVRALLATLSTGGATRITARTPYALAARLSARFFPTSATVFVATGEDFHNALAGGAAAAVQRAPMLLVSSTTLPQVTATELSRLDPTRIVLIGTKASVSSSVAAALSAYGTVERVAGRGPAATAAAVAGRFFGADRPAVFLAGVTTFTAAAAAVPAAGGRRSPLLWAGESRLTATTRAQLVRLSPARAYLVGGRGTLGVPVAKAVQRLLGVCWSGDKPSDETQQVISRVPAATKQVALTFDMAGRLVPARQIVSYLAANQVCTTFFLSGAMARTEEGHQVVSRIARRPELFEIGNHTMHHCDLVRGGGGSPTSAPCQVSMTATFIRAELTSARDVIDPMTRMQSAPYWRPPYSSYNPFVLDNVAAAGYPKTIQFNRDTIDWKESSTASDIVARVLDPPPPAGTIVLFHLGGYHTLESLPWIVNALRGAGYKLTTVSDLLD